MSDTKNTVFVGNIAFTTTQDQLQNIFGGFGQITEIKIPTDRETGKPRGFAFVTFDTESAASSALTLDETECNGRAIRVSLANGKREDRPRFSSGGGQSRFGGNRSSNGGGFDRGGSSGFGRSDRRRGN